MDSAMVRGKGRLKMDKIQRWMIRAIMVLVLVLMITEGAEQVYDYHFNDCMTDSECEGVE